jgi:hypothetical protein
MRGLLGLVMGASVALAVAAAAYGLWLVATVDREFAPRGAVGTLSLILAAILGGVAFVTWRHSH